MPGPSRFDTTRWSLVLAAQDDDPETAKRALGDLCQTYWYPLYAYVRRQGFAPEDACDLTQSFLTLLLERRDFASVRRERGKLRAFLLASLRHFLLNDLARRRSAKRGAGHTSISIEAEAAELRYGVEPADTNTPETVFDRRWALALLDQTFQRLRADCVAEGSASDFDVLKPCLMGEPPPGGYKAVAAQLGSSEGAIKVAVHRLRRRFHERLRESIASTVADEAAVEEELRYLLKALDA